MGNDLKACDWPRHCDIQRIFHRLNNSRNFIAKSGIIGVLRGRQTQPMLPRSGSGSYIGEVRPLQTYISSLSYTILTVFIHKSLIDLQPLQMCRVVRRCVVKKPFSTSDGDQGLDPLCSLLGFR